MTLSPFSPRTALAPLRPRLANIDVHVPAASSKPISVNVPLQPLACAPLRPPLAPQRMLDALADLPLDKSLPERAMQALDALASSEDAVRALVAEARAELAAEALDRDGREALAAEMLARRAAAFAAAADSPPRADEASIPFWGLVTGPLRLVRSDFALKSPAVGRLEAATRVQVLERRQTADGVTRAAISLEGMSPGKTYGWMTLTSKDGAENVSYFDEPLESDEYGVRLHAVPAPRELPTINGRCIMIR